LGTFLNRVQAIEQGVANPVDTAKRAYSIRPKLPDWTKRIKELERQVADLKARIDPGS